VTGSDSEGRKLLNRVTRNGLAVAAAGAFVLTVLGKEIQAVSFLLGAGVGILLLASSRYAVARIFQPGVKKPGALALLATLGRWGVAAFVVWLTVRSKRCDVPAFVAGATVVSAVLLGVALSDWRQCALEDRRRRLAGEAVSRRDQAPPGERTHQTKTLDERT
jgi:hypothetical protein